MSLSRNSSLFAFSFADFAEEDIFPHLPSQILTDEHREKLSRSMRLFPMRPSMTCFGFEMPLSSEKWADLQFRIPLNAANLDALSDLQSLDRTWADFSSILQSTAASGFFHRRGVKWLWLELDTGSQNVWPPSPNFFYEISARHGDPLHQIEEAFAHVKKKHLPQQTAAIIRQSLESNFEIFGIGFMLARSSNALRISLRNGSLWPISTYKDYLTNLNYRYLAQSDLELLERISPSLRTIALEMDIEEGQVLPRMGWSLFTEDSNESWGNLLSHLTREGLADSTKADALRSWRGGQLHHPELLLPSLFRREEEDVDFIIRAINHIKLSTAPNREPGAKIYLRVQKMRHGSRAYLEILNRRLFVLFGIFLGSFFGHVV